MSAPHVTSEQLALLAMDADVDDDVRTHVAACPACTKDLSLIRSLLNADGPDSEAQSEGDPHDPTAEPDLPPAAFTAMADAADGRDDPAAHEVARPAADAVAPGVGTGTGTNSRRHSAALVAGIVIAAALITLVVLLWR